VYPILKLLKRTDADVTLADRKMIQGELDYLVEKHDKNILDKYEWLNGCLQFIGHMLTIWDMISSKSFGHRNIPEAHNILFMDIANMTELCLLPETIWLTYNIENEPLSTFVSAEI
jgi:hypothetical protein